MRLPSQSLTITSDQSMLAAHRVLRNTYLLLGLTTVFSAFTAWFAMRTNAHPNLIVLIVGMIGLQLLTHFLRNSVWGLVSIFAFTGFMGYTLGPVLNHYLHQYTNGLSLVITAFSMTGLIFFALSAYAITTKKYFGYMGGTIMALMIVGIVGGIASAFFNMPLLSIGITGLFAVVAAGAILYHTSEIIHGGETNYISATISLYIWIFNLFINLLRILSYFAGNSRD